MRAKTMCILLALGLLLFPAAEAHPDDGSGGDEELHCPPFLNEDGSIHQHCLCFLLSLVGLCDPEL